MYLDKFLSILREFEDAQGGRDAIGDLKIITFVNGEREPLRVSLTMGGAHGVIIGGEWYLIKNFESKYVEIKLWLIRFKRPEETTWQELWNSIERGWGDTYIDDDEQAEASQVMPVSICICYDRDCFLYQVYERREPFCDLDGLEVLMGEEAIEFHFSYDRIEQRETIKVR